MVALPLTYRERSLTKSVHSKLSRTVFTRSWPKKCHLKEGHFPENPKIVEFSIIPEIPRRISNGTEIPGTQVSKIFGKSRKGVLFSKVLENAFALDARKFRKLKSEILVEWYHPPAL